MVDAGAQCVYVVDSAGALVLSDAQERVRRSLTRSARRPQGGLPRHQNLSLGVANSVLAYQAGARQIDGALCALGAGAGNSPTEVLAATFDRLGVQDRRRTSKACSRRPRTWCDRHPRLPWMDRASITQGYAGCTPAF